MSTILKSLSEQVIVITGASSGIGLATAYAAAKHGARVVLSSRNGPELERIVGTIRAGGGTAKRFVGTGPDRVEQAGRGDWMAFKH